MSHEIATGPDERSGDDLGPIYRTFGNLFCGYGLTRIIRSQQINFFFSLLNYGQHNHGNRPSVSSARPVRHTRPLDAGRHVERGVCGGKKDAEAMPLSRVLGSQATHRVRAAHGGSIAIGVFFIPLPNLKTSICVEDTWFPAMSPCCS